MLECMFKQLKQAYHDLKQELEGSKTKYQYLLAEKEGLQTDYDHTVLEWKRQIEMKTEEFDRIKRQLLPQK